MKLSERMQDAIMRVIEGPVSELTDLNDELETENKKLVRYVRAETTLKNSKNKKVTANQLVFLSRQAHMTYQALSDETRKAIEASGDDE